MYKVWLLAIHPSIFLSPSHIESRPSSLMSSLPFPFLTACLADDTHDGRNVVVASSVECVIDEALCNNFGCAIPLGIVLFILSLLLFPEAVAHKVDTLFIREHVEDTVAAQQHQ